MRQLSIQWKITLWFSVAILIIAAFSIAMVLYINDAVVQKEIRDGLVERVADNIGKVRFVSNAAPAELSAHPDSYITYNNGYLFVADDFLANMDGVYTSVYAGDGKRLYGENPVELVTALIGFDAETSQVVPAGGTKYYVFDRRLKGDGLDNLWIRGVVSQNRGTSTITALLWITFILIPLLTLLALVGGFLAAGSSLRPLRELTASVSGFGLDGSFSRRIPTETAGEGDEAVTLAREVNRMLDRVEQEMSANREISASIARQMERPIQEIARETDSALAAPRTQREYVQSLRTIGATDRHLAGLLDTVLTITGLQQEPERFRKEDVDLSALAQEVLNGFRPERQITLQADILPGVHVTGDPALLRQLLDALLQNAGEFARERGQIAVALGAEKNRLRLTVTDDGPGLTREKLSRVFEPFYQTDAARTAEHWGLGLTLGRHIARFHDGSLSLDSEYGKRCTATFTMPISGIRQTGEV